MKKTKQLFDIFPPVSPEDWISQVIKDLKGKPFESLQYTTVEGIKVNPFYTMDDLKSEFRPLFGHTDWNICEIIKVTEDSLANQQALEALGGGADGLHFFIEGSSNPEILLRDIPLTSVQTIINTDNPEFIKGLSLYISKQGWSAEQIQLAINSDFIADTLKNGRNQPSSEQEFENWIGLFNQTNPYRSLLVDATNYHEAGAPPAYQLACTLAHLHAFIASCADKGMEAKNWSSRVQIHLAVGTDYFFEIAKFRALRKLLALLGDSYETNIIPHIHAITAKRHLTIYDAHNNLLRNTTAAMAAVIGGCNSISVLPYDYPFAPINEFSARLARNIPLILKHESHFDKIADASAGAYFIESLTEQIAEKAWEEFRVIEASGGLIENLREGTIQKRIREFAEEELEAFEQGTIQMVGTNKYPNLNEISKDKIQLPLTETAAQAQFSEIQPLSIQRLAQQYELTRLKEEENRA